MLLEIHDIIKGKFNTQSDNIQIPELDLNIYNFPFISGEWDDTGETALLHELRNKQIPDNEDDNIKENIHFRYPIFAPSVFTRFPRVIFLLHGLNERKWDKYYLWAHSLVKDLQIPVILFPISFHLNRSPKEWIDPRDLSEKVERRKKLLATAEDTTFINLALSERLSSHPERFYLSGLQTLNDLDSLMKQIYTGRHPLFEKETQIDFFSYSIGGLLSQVLMISNQEEFLSRSKYFFFSAGSTFSDMHGASRLIMDTPAHERVQHFYRVELEDHIEKPGKISDFFQDTRLGKAFRAMIAPDRLRSLREKTFLSLRNRIQVVAIENDHVIPADKIAETFECINDSDTKRVEILSPDYPYTHESPFPVKLENYRQSIEKNFSKVFSKAASFLA